VRECPWASGPPNGMKMRGLFFVERAPSLPRRDSSRRSRADRVNLAPWSASSTERSHTRAHCRPVETAY
jgi:hypothetical protein